MVSGPYGTDLDGLLFEPGIRDSLRMALPDDRLLGYEALLALRRAAFVLDTHTRAQLATIALTVAAPSGSSSRRP